MKTELTLPELGLLAGTRGMLGAGLGLLLAHKLSEGQRKNVGWTLAAIGVATTVPAGASYIVMQAPPAQQPPEAVPPRPSAQHVWVPGHWTWQNNQYAWMGGHWETPPSNASVWVNPRWTADGGSYRFYEGYWN